VATQARKFVDRAANPAVAVLDTRKTTPGMRLLEKYAVQCGGGVNHRMGLYDQILIKENHIAAAGGIRQALAGARKAYGDKHPVQVEVRNQEELILAVEGGADSVLLDNMTPAQVKKLCKLVGRRIPTEASGGVTLSNIKDYAASGVTRISVGALTHSAPSADLSMLFLGPQA
jgi:nicotinate-nucleotide pyrophosphorylase (carboxylating)